MRPLAWSMALLFGLAAAVQWNDPDPLRWIAFYLLAAATSLGVALDRSQPALEWVATGVAAVVVIALAPALAGARAEAFLSVRMESSSDELPRELAGAMIALLWSGGLVIRRRWSGASARTG
jgi:hypothetical protein